MSKFEQNKDSRKTDTTKILRVKGIIAMLAGLFMVIMGINLLNIFPKSVGDITYTCWMGMITSNISVVSSV
ncbi:MAG: hypothetical protein WC677_04710 [Clostridia bacterium]